jgi:hypothetical protein
MEFITSRPDVVRSNNQRWLCDYWSRARAGARLPAWRGIDDDEFAAVRADLSCSDVAPANGQPRFRIRFHGERVAQLYGRENCIGKFLDEILPDAYREAALSSYRHVLASRLPVYTVADMRDPGGRIVHYERLLLPFGQNGIGRSHPGLARNREPGRRLREPRFDECAAAAARLCALHDDPGVRLPRPTAPEVAVLVKQSENQLSGC